MSCRRVARWLGGIVGVVVLAVPSTAQQQRWFVRPGGTGSGQGAPLASAATNWANASGDLGAILVNAGQDDFIHVQEGTYVPNIPIGGSAVNATFEFAPQQRIQLLGAYLGTENPYAMPTEPPLGSPDNTILSGDLNFDGIGDVYHVVSILYGQDNIQIDGFVIEFGRAVGPMNPLNESDRCGAGLYAGELFGSQGGTNSLRISRVTFRNCFALLSGGGLYVNLAADFGMKYCSFRNNVAVGQDTMGGFTGGGGGMAFRRLSAIPQSFVNRIWSCEFSNNRGLLGGGMLGQGGDPGATVEVANCRFNDNVARAGGGILLDGEVPQGPVPEPNQFTSRAQIRYCTFAYNTVSAPTGSLYFGGSAIFVADYSNALIPQEIRNCIAYFDTATLAGQMIPDAEIRAGDYLGNPPVPNTTVSYSDVAGSGVYVGTGNINTNPSFVNGTQRDLRLKLGSPCIDAGDDSAISADVLDLDGDNDVGEWMPRDFRPDVQREIATVPVPTGIDAARPNKVADMGCFEHTPIEIDPQ